MTVAEYDTLETDDDGFLLDMFLDDLGDLMGDGARFTVRGQHVGWRNISGETTVETDSPRDLLMKVAPSSDFRAKLNDLGDGSFQIVLHHHDSPTGETHTFVPAD